MRLTFPSAFTVVALAASPAFAGETCKGHFEQCKTLESRGSEVTVPCEKRLEDCRATKIWVNGRGKSIKVDAIE